MRVAHLFLVNQQKMGVLRPLTFRVGRFSPDSGGKQLRPERHRRPAESSMLPTERQDACVLGKARWVIRWCAAFLFDQHGFRALFSLVAPAVKLSV